MMKSLNLLVLLGIGLVLVGCGGSESPAPSSDGKSNVSSKRRQTGTEESAQHIDNGTRSLEEAISQSVAENGSIQVDCLSKTLATNIQELRNAIPDYEKFVQRFHENKSDIRFFVTEARAASSRSLENLFSAYLEAKLNGLMKFDARKVTEIEAEMEKLRLSSLRKLRGIKSKVLEKSHEGIENFANTRTQIVECFSEVNSVLKKEFDLKKGNDITHAIERLNSVAIGTMTLKNALSAGDDYLNTAIEQLKIATDELMQAYDKLVPGFFSQKK